MKSTRNIFCVLTESVRRDIALRVMAEISGYKAVTLLLGRISPESTNAQNVFALNKNIVCEDPTVEKAFKNAIIIGINNPAQKHNIRVFVTSTAEDIRKQFEAIAEDCDVDIGDHKSNATKEGPSQDPMDCVFCRYFAGKPDHEQPSIYETENFVLMCNTGHFTPGCLQIVPRKHVMSCAEFDKATLDELLEVIEDARYILRAVYGKETLLWENGSGNGGHGKDKSSIVHAHIHMNPCDMNILEVSANKGIVPVKINFEDLPKYAEESYLLIQDYNLEWYIVSNPNIYIPRQYVRQLVAEHLGLPGDLWNWRKHMFLDEVLETAKTIREYLISHKDTLPARIVERTKHFA